MIITAGLMVNNMADTVDKPKRMKKKSEEYPLSTFGAPSDGIGEALQTAYLKSTMSDGKRRKNNKDLLESLKKGEALQKDEDDATLLANTYDPEADPKHPKCNKRRQRQTKEADNLAFNDSENETIKTIHKKTKKKKVTELIEEIPKAVEVQSEASTADSPIPPIRQTKKKKKMMASRSSPESDTEASKVLSKDDVLKKEVAQMEVIDETKGTKEATETKTKRKKKTKKKSDDGERASMAAAYATSLNDAEAAAEAALEDTGQVLQVIVHRTDKLKSDFYISHPLVRVHIIDMETGRYLKKQNKNRPVSSRFETENEYVDYILPIMTFPYDFKKNHSTLPVWEDHIIFNENFKYFVHSERKVLLIFELVDFVRMNTANKHYNNESQRGGWHQIAWSFLKLVGANENPNVGKKVRLQLYLPPTRVYSKEGHVEMFSWWSSNQRITYPSTLYVSVKSIVISKEIEPSTRSMFAIQEEKGRMAFDDIQRRNEREFGQESRPLDAQCKQCSPWLRLDGQQCKIPNLLMCSLSAGRKGCFVLKFSHNGQSLACGCHERDTYPILIYEIPSGKLRTELTGHCSIIYDICWSSNDQELISASGDGTCRVWDVAQPSESLKKMLPHPSFVYSAKYHPMVNKVVVTGGYDRLVRIWSLQTDDLQALLLQELDGHFSVINALCFDEDGMQLYSGDSLGNIISWNVFVTDKQSSKGLLKEWTKNKELTDPDFKGSAINTIALHPNGRRLLVHSRNNKLYLIDLRIQSVMHKYVGALNFREHIRSTMTPCGTFVFAGSEDGQVYVWNTDTGDQVVVYSNLGYRHSVCAVDFHPFENIAAFCSHGDNQPVKLYKYDPNAAQKDITSEFAEPFCGQRSELPTTSRLQNQDQTVYRPDSTFSGATGDFNISQKARLEQVMQRLQTIGQSSRLSTVEPMTLGGADSSQQYMTTMSGGSDWRPSFTPVGGRTGSSRGMDLCKPQINITGMDGKTKVQFTASPGSQTSKPEVVVVLYDYLAQRSDELTLIRGDRVKVIYKDNDNWWMGELENGQQGFFPTNYVLSGSADKTEKQSTETKRDETSRTPLSVPADSDAESPAYRKTTHAVVDKNGELKYISATEDSDAEATINRQKKRKTRKSQGSMQITIDAQIEKPPRSNRTKKKASSPAPTRDSQC